MNRTKKNRNKLEIENIVVTFLGKNYIILCVFVAVYELVCKIHDGQTSYSYL